MTESAGLTLIETMINAVSGFDSTGSAENIAIAKWGILNSGRSDHYAIIVPGVMNRPRSTLRTRDSQYRTNVEVWQRYKDDGTTVTSLLGHVNNILAQLDKYRKLGDTTGAIRNSDAIEVSEVTEQWRENADGPSWVRRTIYIDWVEESTPTYAE